MNDFAKTRFPAPPRYFLQFVDEGVSVRPPNPPPGAYVMFGDTYPPPGVDEVRPLSDSGQTLLCPALASLEKEGTSTEVDAVSELKNMTHSIVLSYIQLLDVLANNPANAHEKIEDLDVCHLSPSQSLLIFHCVIFPLPQLLFVNVHHLLNEFRPWQARKDLIEIMEAQIARRKATIAELQAAMAEACTSLQEGFRAVEATESAEAAARSSSS